MSLFDMSGTGGWIMIALLVLGLILYFILAERLLEQRLHVATADALCGLRRTGIVRALIVLAPMLGLLGTVCGIIQTFYGLADGTTSQDISSGIHTALFTTEYGLAIAIPAFVLEKLLKRRSRQAASADVAMQLRAVDGTRLWPAAGKMPRETDE